MVFQNYVIYLYFMVYGNLVFGLKVWKVFKLEMDEWVQSVVKMLGIDRYFDRKF